MGLRSCILFVGRFSLDQLLAQTAQINEQIKNVIDAHTEPWGTQVTAVEIKDITLPDNMQRAMAKEAERLDRGVILAVFTLERIHAYELVDCLAERAKGHGRLAERRQHAVDVGDTVQVFDNHDTRSSDEAAWATAGFPTMRWAGMAKAGDYWAYHKMNDTMETMVKQAGGQDVLVAGFENAAKDAYYTILAVDATTLVYGK